MSLAAEDLYRLGVSLLNEGNPSEAVHYFRLAEKDLSEDYDFGINLGQALADIGEHEEAIERYRRCIDNQPERPESYEKWADLSQKQGKKEEAKKLRAWAEARAPKKAEVKKAVANWEPEASAIKVGDIEFECPKCEVPIRYGSEDLTCPNCRQNLMPIRHGHIRPYWRLDGEQDFQCAKCELPLEGTELTCPHCQTNLLTGETPDDHPTALETLHAPKKFRSPVGIAAMVIGFLLLTIAIGQFRTTRTREGAKHAWTAIVQRVSGGVDSAERTMADTKDQPDYIKDISVNGSTNLTLEFFKYFGIILFGMLTVLLGALKYYFDR